MSGRDPDRIRRILIRLAIFAVILVVLALQTALVTAIAFPDVGLLRWLGW